MIMVQGWDHNYDNIQGQRVHIGGPAIRSIYQIYQVPPYARNGAGTYRNRTSAPIYLPQLFVQRKNAPTTMSTDIQQYLRQNRESEARGRKRTASDVQGNREELLTPPVRNYFLRSANKKKKDGDTAK